MLCSWEKIYMRYFALSITVRIRNSEQCSWERDKTVSAMSRWLFWITAGKISRHRNIAVNNYCRLTHTINPPSCFSNFASRENNVILKSCIVQFWGCVRLSFPAFIDVIHPQKREFLGKILRLCVIQPVYLPNKYFEKYDCFFILLSDIIKFYIAYTCLIPVISSMLQNSQTFLTNLNI